MQQKLDAVNERIGYKKLPDIHTEQGLEKFRQFMLDTLSTVSSSSVSTSSPALWWEMVRAAQCVRGVRHDVAEDVTLVERRVKSEKHHFAMIVKNKNLHAFKTIVLCLTEPSTEIVAFPECIKARKPCDAYVVFEDCEVMSKTYADALNSRPKTLFESMYREFVLAFK
jgi:hypothetical protein